MKIGIDLDGTLSDMHAPWLAIYNERFGDNLTKEDLHGWDIDRYVKPECGEKVFEILDEPGFFRNAPVQPFAQEALTLLRKDHTLYVVTAYYHLNAVMEQKIGWLLEHFPMIDPKNIIFCNPKSLLSGLDLLIDDSPKNIEMFPNAVLVYKHKWNECLGNKFPFLESWKDIIDGEVVLKP